MQILSRRSFMTASVTGLAASSVLMSSPSLSQPQLPLSDLAIQGQRGVYKLRVELAESRKELMEGLMFRRSLPRDGGMLFNYRKPIEVSMWMKNTFIPLDMIFIRSSGIISQVTANVEPQSTRQIQALEPVIAVLEVNAGVTDALGIVAGHKVYHSIFNNYPPKR